MESTLHFDLTRTSPLSGLSRRDIRINVKKQIGGQPLIRNKDNHLKEKRETIGQT
jgi:hypothetical protein